MICGSFQSTFTMGTTSLGASGGGDFFVAKFNSSTGANTWATAAGGTGGDVAYKIGADKLGNVYPAGSFEGTCNYGTNSTVSQGLADIFHAKITQPGSGIEQEEENLQVLLFPNPATETFSLSLLNRKDAGNLFLYSSTGELIRTWELMSGANHCSLSGIPAGIYFYRVSDDGNRGAAGKLLVQ